MANTAALIEIGNELVRGEPRHENRLYISGRLESIGIRMESVHIIRDEVETIAEFVRFLSSRVTYVFTTGGLGPTLDDVTLESVARAFGLAIVSRAPSGASSYAAMSGSETAQPLLRHIPDGAELITTDHGPVVRTHNVYSLPGLPRLVKLRFPALSGHLRGQAIHSRKLSLNALQSQIAGVLELAQQKYPSVSIGCYPSANPKESTSIHFEGFDADEVEHCLSFVKGSLAKRGSQ